MEATVKKVSHSGSSTTFIQSVPAEKEKNKNKLHLNFQDNKTQHITSSNDNPVHVVKIKVNPDSTSTVKINISSTASTMHKSELTSVSTKSSSPNNASYFYYNQYPGIVLPSAQSSLSDTLDSGTCSDLDGSTPPPLPKKKSIVTFSSEGSSVAGSSINSDDEISCDSLNSSELEEITDSKKHEDDSNIDFKASFKEKQKLFSQKIVTINENNLLVKSNNNFDAQVNNTPNEFESVAITESAISESVPRVSNETSSDSEMVNINNNENCVSENSVSDRVEKLVISNSRDHHTGLTKMKFKRKEIHYEDDQHYKFHLNENNFDTDDAKKSQQNEEDDYFAGYKNLDGMTSSATSTIKSSKGTVRGVKNRVRAGIATFLTMPTTKTWQEKETGKIVMYSTTMGIVRDTYHRCLKVKQILRTHLVKFDDKDVFMSRETQQEFKERLGTDVINVPQIFVEGVHIGDADAIERLNESGELRRILKPYKSPDACTICQVCGGYRLLPCSLCNGSKKSVHRNHFTTELVALKCMNCDEVGLVKCYAC
ncbi:hypothetical protein M8J75_006083 [Diaphorina citri]|nr:hypothetical protein M8J75_006083 [Diaphorina citri]